MNPKAPNPLDNCIFETQFWAPVLFMCLSCQPQTIICQDRPYLLESKLIESLLVYSTDAPIYYYGRPSRRKRQTSFSYKVSSGMSSSSRREHRCSPNNIIPIVPVTWMIHQSQVDGTPLYMVHAIR